MHLGDSEALQQNDNCVCVHCLPYSFTQTPSGCCTRLSIESLLPPLPHIVHVVLATLYLEARSAALCNMLTTQTLLQSPPRHIAAVQSHIAVTDKHSHIAVAGRRGGMTRRKALQYRSAKGLSKA